MSPSFDIEVGLDLHRHFSLVAAIDSSGTVLNYRKISNQVKLFDAYFKALPVKRFRVTFESTMGSGWLIEYFSDRQIPYIMSNPFLNRAIANVHAKNDKYDARILAQLTRTNLIAPCYVPVKPIRYLRDLIIHRSRLVRISTKLKNKIRFILATHNLDAPYTSVAGHNASQWLKQQQLPPVAQDIIKDILEVLDCLRPKILDLANRIKDHVHRHPYYRLLQSAPGIGPLNAATIIARIDTIDRFPRLEGFIRYAGLAVTTRASADHIHMGKLNKKSDKHLRTVFVEAAINAVAKDPGLAAFYTYLRTLKGTGIARCAVARKLARSVYYMLKRSNRYYYQDINIKYEVAGK